MLAAVSLAPFLVLSVQMLFFLWNISAAIDPIPSYSYLEVLGYFWIWFCSTSSLVELIMCLSIVLGMNFAFLRINFFQIHVIYFVIISLTYYFIAKSSFAYIPGYYLSGIHRYTSLLAVAVGILLFLLTSFSDPGTINSENVSQYISAYPYDNIIYAEKECSTCKIQKPARSKHCSICDRCVARFDHHCGWMNNCIGERNTRYFMAFLVWHFLLCLYGTVGIGLLLAGRLKELRVVHILTVYYGIENSFLGLAPHVVQWLLGSYHTLILLVVFLAIVGMLLAGFFGYHAKLCLSNTTTNETFKWQEYMSWQRKVNEAETSAAALRASISGMSNDKKPLLSKWRTFFRRSPLEDVQVVPKNLYDKGIIRNVLEVIFPLSTRRSLTRCKLKPT
ncbi:putative protein S-acyltransferase 17 [Senna tora]|uniref:S-acyltransferase n=1 Tax=Senna tora TaxID=362788 RepID=A0A834TI69_9FABA|nr:putative protein S-acyltransferase 17 [Senna tora]